MDCGDLLHLLRIPNQAFSTLLLPKSIHRSKLSLEDLHIAWPNWRIFHCGLLSCGIPMYPGFPGLERLGQSTRRTLLGCSAYDICHSDIGHYNRLSDLSATDSNIGSSYHAMVSEDGSSLYLQPWSFVSSSVSMCGDN